MEMIDALKRFGNDKITEICNNTYEKKFRVCGTTPDSKSHRLLRFQNYKSDASYD